MPKTTTTSRRGASTRRKTATKKNTTKILEVGVLGRPVQTYALKEETTVQELATTMGIDFAEVEASKNGRTAFKELKGTDKVNGYAAILFTPKVDGGKGF